MHTTCPECSSVFRVSAEQLNAAHGQVRCGYCQTIFDALGNLEDDWKESLIVLEEKKEPPVAVNPELQQNDEADHQHHKIEPVLPLDELLKDNVEPANDSEASQGIIPNDDEPSALSELRSSELFKKSTTSETEFIKQESFDIKRQTEALFGKLASQISHQKSSNIHKKQIDKRDSPTHEESEAEPPPINIETDDTPAVLREELAAVTAELEPSYTYAWIAGIIFLTLTLLLQGLFYFKDDLAQNESTRGFIVSLCQIFSCDVPLRNDARHGKKSIVMLSHAITRVSGHDNQLRIKAIFTNTANYKQSYPVLSIKMIDASEEISAMRRFLPQEYLAPHIDINQGLPATTSVEIFIDIIKPASPVVSYQFDFL